MNIGKAIGNLFIIFLVLILVGMVGGFIWLLHDLEHPDDDEWPGPDVIPSSTPSIPGEPSP
jgi:hypothetical protein